MVAIKENNGGSNVVAPIHKETLRRGFQSVVSDVRGQEIVIIEFKQVHKDEYEQ